jgi:hypothetical protein
MPGLAQVAPAFNLFFTTGVMVALAGASAPLIFLISMVGMGATASSLAQFAGVIVLAIPIWGDLRPGQPSPYNVLPWLTLGLIAVGVIYAAVLALARPAALERAPALLEGDESLATDPLLTKG